MSDPPAQMPVAGHDYPRTYQEFRAWFPDDASCARYLRVIRWPDGFVCPACGHAGEPWSASRGRLVCPCCRHQTSVTTGTVLDKTRTPLTTWFAAAWLVATAKNGLSAMTLHRTLGIAYRTAWMILHRFRVAMVRSNRGRLAGDVEVDEAFVGGKGKGGKRGRGSFKKEIVVIAVEIKQPIGFGRVRMRLIPDATQRNLRGFISDVVTPGSQILTDGHPGYRGLHELGYGHDIALVSASADPAHVSMPGVHRVASLLKRWLLGTHQGSAKSPHLQAYLEEFTFRFNRRTSSHRGLVFRRLMEQAVVTGPITEPEVKGGYRRENGES